MPGKRSAALLVHRVDAVGEPQILLGHMGGPFWVRRPQSWTLPKGEYPDEEGPLDAARREFKEETGLPAPRGEYISLGEVRQSGGKVVSAWAVRAEPDVSQSKSNTFVMEWPRGSGQMQEFPELDELRWVDVASARTMLIRAQVEFLDRLLDVLRTENDV